MSQMQVLDRMVFDINRRALIDINKERYVASSVQKPSKSITKSEVPVYERLIEDINRRNEVKQRLEEYTKAQEDVKSLSTSKLITRNESEAVFNRLLHDVERRFESKHAAELFKEKEAEQEVESFSTATKPMSREETQQMVHRLNAEAEFRQHKLEVARQEKEQKEIEEAKRLANLRHPKRALNPKVQERLTQEQKIIAESYGVPERSKSAKRGSKTPDKLAVDIAPKKLFTVQETIKSGIRLMNARTYRSRRAVEDPPAQEPKRLSVKKESIVAQMYRSRISDMSPSKYSQMSEQPYSDAPYTIQVTESEYSPTALSPSIRASEFKRKPIQLRERPGSLTKTSSVSLKSSGGLPSEDHLKQEFHKAGRYNHSKAFAEMKQRTDRESPERVIPKPSRDRQVSPERSASPETRRSPLRRVNRTADNLDIFTRTSYQLTPEALDYSDRSYLSTPIRASSPKSSKVRPSPRLITREALNLPSESETERPVMSYSEEHSIAKEPTPYRQEEPKLKSLESTDRKRSPNPKKAERQDIYSTAERSPLRFMHSQSTKSLQPSQPSSRRQLTYSQESQYLMMNPLKARMEQMAESPGVYYRPLLVESSYEPFNSSFDK
mmetsp:Transcript_27192/g.48836  ORF Transcript_27192/g.48836 Transcript_27192/m.48836 type:complete len:610 (-) Transcript_27192:1163-2992(-)